MLAGKTDSPEFTTVFRINFTVGGQIVWHACHGGMTLGLDRQVKNERVAGLDAVFHEETVAHGVVGDIVFHPQVIGAVHGDAAVKGIVDGRVPDVLTIPACANQVPVNRIAGQFHMLPHAIEFDALDIHLAGDHRHDVSTEIRLKRIF